MRPTSKLLPTALLTASFCASAADSCHYAKLADLPLHYVGRNLELAVDGTVNDKPALMVLQATSDFSMVTSTGIKRTGLEVRATTFKVTGAGERARVYNAYIDRMSIGQMRIDRPLELIAIDDTGSPPEYDLVLGAPFLMKFDPMIDLSAQRLKLYQAQGCTGVDLHPWKEGTVAVPITGFKSNSTNPHFDVVVNGKKLDAVFSFNVQHSYMTLEAAQRAGIDAKGSKVPVKTVQIGSETINDAALGVIDAQGERRAELFLGQDFLRTHRVLFANSQDRIYIAYLGGIPFPEGRGVEPR